MFVYFLRVKKSIVFSKKGSLGVPPPEIGVAPARQRRWNVAGWHLPDPSEMKKFLRARDWENCACAHVCALAYTRGTRSALRLKIP